MTERAAVSSAVSRSLTTLVGSRPPFATCVRRSARTLARNSLIEASARRSSSRLAIRSSARAEASRYDEEEAPFCSSRAAAARSARRLFMASCTLWRTSFAMRRTESLSPASMPCRSPSRAVSSARPASVIA